MKEPGKYVDNKLGRISPAWMAEKRNGRNSAAAFRTNMSADKEYPRELGRNIITPVKAVFFQVSFPAMRT